MKRESSSTLLAMHGAIFRKTRSTPRRPEPLPSEIPTYDYSAHMKSVRELHMINRSKR